MWKYTVHVEGMMCGMCESHVNDAVRKAFPVKKVTSSRSRNETTVIAETELDEDALRTAISATGYEVGEIRKEPWENCAGGISGGSGRLGSGDARRTGLPVLPGGGDFPPASPTGPPAL